MQSCTCRNKITAVYFRFFQCSTRHKNVTTRRGTFLPLGNEQTTAYLSNSNNPRHEIARVLALHRITSVDASRKPSRQLAASRIQNRASGVIVFSRLDDYWRPTRDSSNLTSRAESFSLVAMVTRKGSRAAELALARSLVAAGSHAAPLLYCISFVCILK